jgi:hypothetical protein
VRRWLDRAEAALTLVAVIATFVMMLLTTADAIGRYVFNRPILVAYELTTNYLMIAAVFLAMPFAYREGANIRVTFLVARLRGTARLVVDPRPSCRHGTSCGRGPRSRPSKRRSGPGTSWCRSRSSWPPR